jgi:hypothetical protein
MRRKGAGVVIWLSALVRVKGNIYSPEKFNDRGNGKGKHHPLLRGLTPQNGMKERFGDTIFVSTDSFWDSTFNSRL